MKRLLALSVALLLLFLPALTFPEQTSNSLTSQTVVTYVWYDDYDLTNQVSVNTIAAEIYRLQQAYPGKTFSSSPGVGLHATFWGYGSPFDIVTIYSNL